MRIYKVNISENFYSKSAQFKLSKYSSETKVFSFILNIEKNTI